MPSEVECRLEIDLREVPWVSSRLNAERRLASCVLVPESKEVHTDSYFDNNEWLYSRGWSLRIRETHDDFKVTLKRPLVGEASDVAVRDELESPRDGSTVDVLVRIATIMSEAGLTGSDRAELRRRLMRGCVADALGALGLPQLLDPGTQSVTREA